MREETKIREPLLIPAPFKSAMSWLFLFVALYLVSLYNYLLFHSIAEMFSIVVAFGIFAIAWNSRQFLDNHYLFFIGIAYLFVGGLDLVHVLAYKGMGVFPGVEANLATQLWIAARYVESLSLLIAPLFLRRKLRALPIFLGYAIATLLLLLSIVYWSIFPVCFIEGTGLTPFKKMSEYVISLILLAAMGLLLKNRREFDRGVLQWVTGSIIMTIASELAFTFYINAYGFSNMIGHFFKITSFYLIYKAIIETGLTKPHDLLFRNLKQSEEALLRSLKESTEHQREVSALLQSSRAILEYHEFKEAARSIFDSCKKLVGASAGYIALLSKDGNQNEVVFLDSGGLPCTVNASLPMPIRGFREEAYRTGRPVFHNEFPKSEWIKYMPEGHSTLENVLFAPLVIKGKAIGLLGLANKPNGFNENDARLASAFGELAAIALSNSRTLEALEHNEQRFRSVTETANEAVISVDIHGKIVLWNKAAENIFGYSADETLGNPLTFFMPERFREIHKKAFDQVVSAGKSAITGKTVEMVGLRKDESEFPLDLSLAKWETRDGVFFTGIIRDITRRKRAEEALRKAHDELERRVEERTAELMVANEQLKQEIEERKRTEEALQESRKQLKHLSSQLLTTQENERKWMAQELHDSIGQMLAATKFSLETKLMQMGPGKAPPGISLEDILSMIQNGIEETRRIMTNLRPSLLDDLGILTTMNWFCREFQKVYPHVHIKKQIDIQEEEVPDQLKIVIFRVLQEGMNNFSKHSKGNLVRIDLERKNNAIEFTIKDNGIGFDLKSAHKGLGLASMKERTELSGGSFAIESAKDTGTMIRASWPLCGDTETR